MPGWGQIDAGVEIVESSLFCSDGCLLYCFISPRFIVLSLSHLPFLGYLTPSCVRFLNYFKEGEETLL